MKKESINSEEIDHIHEYFAKNKVKMIKMNHCLNDAGFTHFEGYIQLVQEEGNFIKIVNKIPNHKYQITSN